MTKTYRTIQGDTWDMIAKNQLGDEHFMSKLMEVNFQHRELSVFPSGVVLTLPEVSQTPQEIELNLPPWKR